MAPFGRAVDYLRISVTNRCNERCLYCMPAGDPGRAWQPDRLTVDEILRVVRVAAGMGLRKFRLTGGEPLVRADLLEIARSMAVIPGVEHIGLSTNGTCLASKARALREAGVSTVNISLDALDAGVYHRMTGGDLDRVLAGIQAAVASGFECVKLNCVLMRGVNEQEIWPLVLFAAEHRVPLRLIELMPVTKVEVLDDRNFLPVIEAMDRLRARDDLVPLPDPRLGHGPAKYYRLPHTGAVVGFIGPLTHRHFCEMCNRLRLTSDGRIRPCLGNHGEVDLRSLLRNQGSDDALAAALRQAINQKPLEHQFRCGYAPGRPMIAVGG